MLRHNQVINSAFSPVPQTYNFKTAGICGHTGRHISKFRTCTQGKDHTKDTILEMVDIQMGSLHHSRKSQFIKNGK